MSQTVTVLRTKDAACKNNGLICEKYRLAALHVTEINSLIIATRYKRYDYNLFHNCSGLFRGIFEAGPCPPFSEWHCQVMLPAGQLAEHLIVKKILYKIIHDKSFTHPILYCPCRFVSQFLAMSKIFRVLLHFCDHS